MEGAEFGPVKYPRASPMAENGSEPATSVASNFAKAATEIHTPPKVIPRANSDSTTTVLNSTLVRSLAVK